MSISKLIHIACFLLLSLPIGWSQSTQLQHFTGKDGLAQSQVYCLLEDQRGYLWLGTQGGGLNRFDGKNFENWRTKNGLANNFVDALYEGRNGLIWIGTKNGLSSFDGFSLKTYKPDANRDIAITSILQKQKGGLWIGTNRGLYSFENEKWTSIAGIKKSIRVNHLFQNEAGLWVSTSRGLRRIHEGEVVNYDYNKNIATRKIECVSQDLDGTIWVGTSNDGVYLIDEKDQVLKMADAEINGKHIQTIFKDQSDNMWMGSQSAGVTIWNPRDSSYQYLNRSTGLLRNDIRSLLQDQWGHIWVGTPGGLSRYAGQQFGQQMLSAEANDNSVYALCEDQNNNLWLSASSKGIAKLKGSQLTAFGQDSGFVDLRCKALFIDKEGRLWIGAEPRGLALYDAGEFQFIKESEGFKSRYVKKMLQDSSGIIWVATADDGIYKIEEKDTIVLETIMVVDSLEGKASGFKMRTDTISKKYFIINRFNESPLRGAYVYDLLQDEEQRLWVATREQGLLCIVDDEIVFKFNKSNGFPDNHIRSLAKGVAGELWLGTANSGILRLNLNDLSSKPERISEVEGLNANNVYALLCDESQIWAGAGKGVNLIILNDARGLKSIQHFDKTDGFAGIEMCTNSILKDRQGRVWFGTVNGLMQYLPNQKNENVKPPVVHLSAIRIGYELLKDSEYQDYASVWGTAKDGLELPYHEDQISFEFQAVNQAKPDQIFYEYFLEGWDRKWLGPYQQNAPANYSNLDPGKYTFRVRASNGDGNYSKKIAHWSFVVKPPFWKTNLFYLICFLGGLVLFFLLAQLYTRRIRRQAAVKTERLEMENTILELEQKALQLQMNPHFIFNVLNSIQSLISQKNERTARYFLAKFSKLMRSILENSREEKIPLEQEIETLEHYLSVERFSRDDQFEYEIYIDPKLDVDSIMMAPMLLQPFLENAIIHGVGQVKEGGKIKLSFIQKYGTLECIIEDNGPGIAAARERKSQQEHTHKSAGLEVTRERLDILNPLAKGKSLEMIDRVAEGVGEGTKVVVRLLL